MDKTIVNLNIEPAALLNAMDNDRVLVDGNVFVASFTGNGLSVFLTCEDPEKYRPKESWYSHVHVRNKAGCACMTIHEMINLIASGQYYLE